MLPYNVSQTVRQSYILKNTILNILKVKIFSKIVFKEFFEATGFEIVPSIYAVALLSATVERDIYLDYAGQILQTIKENPDAGGIYIWFHGSMEVEGIGSGELYLLKEIRKIVSEECIIAMTMDAHANITDVLPQDLRQYLIPIRKQARSVPLMLWFGH